MKWIGEGLKYRIARGTDSHRKRRGSKPKDDKWSAKMKRHERYATETQHNENFRTAAETLGLPTETPVQGALATTKCSKGGWR